MTDFTIINPTKNSFRTGTNINQRFVLGIQTVGNPSVGNGTLVTFMPTTLIATGNYSAVGSSGTFAISITPSNGNFTVQVDITGTLASNSRSFTAAASQPASHTVQLTDVTGSGPQVVLSQNNGSWVTDGKIDIDPNWVPITLYIDSNV